MEVTAKFLEMLLAGASREDLDLVVAEAEVSGSSPEQLASLRERHALAMRIHEQMERQRSREAELSALFETARDLTAIRDLDAILAAIVRRARQLLHADMTYLSLNDELEGASYMKVTDGALTPEFRQLRLPLGTGLLGLVAQSGAPVGALSDKVGRRPLYFVGAVGVGVWSFFFFGLLDTNRAGPVLLAVVVGLFFHTLMYAPQSAFFSELFGTSVRYMGASVGYQLASIFAGALAPIIAVDLLGSADERNTTAVALYVAAASILTVIAVFFAKESRGTSLRHDRVVRGAHD